MSNFQIREQMAEFINKRLSLQEFEEWLVRNTWNVHSFESQAAEDLAADVEELLARYSSAHLSLSDIRENFATLLHANNVVIDYVEAWPIDKPIRNSSVTPVRVVLAQL